MRETAIKIATEELKHPTLGVSEQIVSSHILNPEPIRIDAEREQGAYFLYFSIVDEDYFFVVALREEDGVLKPSASWIEANAQVYLSVHTEQKTPNEITELLGIQPTSSGKMGEHPAHRPSGAVNKCHYWCFEPQKDIPESLEKKVDVLLESMEVCHNELKSLSESCSVTLTVCYEGYKDWMGGVVLSPYQLAQIAEMKAGIWVDLYASGPDLPD